MPDITSNLVAWYKLDETSGTSAADSNGSGYTGTYVNAPTLGVAGAFSGSRGVTFASASSQYVTIADNDAFSSHAGGEITLAAWVKPTSLGAAKSFLSKAAGANYEFAQQISSSGKVVSSFFLLNGSNSDTLSSFATLSTGTWYHIAITYVSGASHKIYINGSLDNSQVPAFATSNGTGLVNIGRRGDATQYSDCTLDDLRIYSRALTSADILFLKNSYECFSSVFRIPTNTVTGAAPLMSATDTYPYLFRSRTL